jgi:hypothetical protein
MPACSLPRASRAATPQSRAACWRPKRPRRWPPGAGDALSDYPEMFRSSGCTRNCTRHAISNLWMAKGLWTGSIGFGIDQVVLRGKAPWTMHNTADHESLRPRQLSARQSPTKAGRCADLRPLILGVPLQYQSRGRPALPSAAQGCSRSHRHQSGALRRAGAALLPGRRL